VRRARREGPIVTLDGPAGSGKSSTAKEVASRLGFRHLDSGALYRALTHALLESGIPEDEWSGLGEADLRSLGVSVEPTVGGYDVSVRGRTLTDELRSAAVTSRVAEVARYPASRGCLLDLQRDAGARGRLVADGRDMGTVVFPEADLKVFLVAELEERARRRLRDEGVVDPTSDDVAVQSGAMAARDRSDSERALSPLRRPSGAYLIDTTRLSFREQVDTIVGLVERLTDP
jgi:cytidylate kinase